MRKLLAIFRGSLHTIAIATVALVIVFYLAIHINLAGMLVEHALSDQLAEQLGTRVTVDGDIEVDWLNQVVLNKLTIYDQHDDTLLYARRTMIAYDLWPILSHHLVLNTCQLIDFDIHAYKASADSATNFQFFIDALQNRKNPDEQPFIQQLDLNSILLRQGSISYNVLDKPHLDNSPIDPNHIEIHDLSANVHVHDKELKIKKFHCVEHKTYMKADNCDLVLNLMEEFNAKDKEGRFLMSVKGMEAENDELTLKADAKCTSKELILNLHKLELPAGHPIIKGVHELYASADIHVTQLKQPLDSLYFDADIRELNVRIDTLGMLQMSGDMEGMPCHAKLDCSMQSDLGDADLTADMECIATQPDTRDFRKRNICVKGHCQTSGFNLSKIVPRKFEMGMLALNADFKANKQPSQPLQIAIKGIVDQLEWHDHTFEDIALDGEYQDKQINGNVALSDTLGDVKADFELDLRHTEHHYKVDGEVAHFNPNALKLSNLKQLDSISFNSKIHADLLTAGLLRSEGEIKLTKLSIDRGDRHLDMEPFSFEGTPERGELNCQLARLQYSRDKWSHEYRIKGRIPVANDLLSMLQIPMAMSGVGTVDVRIDTTAQVKEAHINLPTVDLQKGKALAAKLDMTSDASGALEPKLVFEASNANHSLEGTLKGRVFTNPLNVTLVPATLLYNKKEKVQITGAQLFRDEQGDLKLRNFGMIGGNQQISATGTLGKNGNKDCLVRLKNFNLGQIFSNFEKGYMQFSGYATGDIVLKSEPDLRLTAENLKVRNFTYIDTLVGNGNLNLEYIIPKKTLIAAVDIETDSIYHTHIDGDIKMGKHDSLDLHFDTDHLPIGFINNWTGDILQQASGRITGKVRLFGDAKRLQIVGHPFVDARFTHNIIGAHFHLKDSVKLDPNLMHLDNAYVDDCHGHSLRADARIMHDHLSDFGYDIEVKMTEGNQGFLALDRQPAPGRFYWGQIYAKGQAHLRGQYGDKHRIDLEVSPGEKSWFYLSPFEQDIDPDEAAYTFLTFRDKKALEDMKKAEEETGSKPPKSIAAPSPDDEDRTDLIVDMRVHASEQCQVYVQLDPLAEDKLICRGNGDLSVRYDPNRDITLSGTYRITQGTYTMCMKGDLMNKVFQLQNTSYAEFNGVPTQADLHLDAKYSIPSVNLSDLDESITTLGSLSRSSVPVDCNLSVTGQLLNPQVNFDLEVKNVSDEIQAYVHNVIGTQEMLNQEVVYLLLFSKFYTPQYANASQSRTGSEITSFASASITSQLNQLLSKVSDNFTMGTNFRSDKGDFSDMEMDVSLSTRLLGDRLLLNGNVGYRDPANRVGSMNNNNSFIGDFDLEYLINTSGTIRAKAYSHYNERDYSINNALTTQGIGFILRKDFKGIHDFWPWNSTLKKRNNALRFGTKGNSGSNKDKNNGKEAETINAVNDSIRTK